MDAIRTETISIDLNGCLDTYEEFDDIFTEPVRLAVHGLASRLAVDADGTPVPDEFVLASGFNTGITEAELAEIDIRKLNRPSAVPDGGFRYDLAYDGMDTEFGFDGDDSNAANVIERGAESLRREKLLIAQRLETEEFMTMAERQELLDRLRTINSEVSELRKARQAASLPIYYATRVANLLHASGEDNPLAYAGYDDNPEETNQPVVALYDRRAIEAAGIVIEEKSDAQFRIYACGANIMAHCIGLIRINYTD